MTSGDAVALDIKNYSKETRTLHVQMVLCRCYHLQPICSSTGTPPFQIHVTEQGKIFGVFGCMFECSIIIPDEFSLLHGHLVLSWSYKIHSLLTEVNKWPFNLMSYSSWPQEFIKPSPNLKMGDWFESTILCKSRRKPSWPILRHCLIHSRLEHEAPATGFQDISLEKW